MVKEEAKGVFLIPFAFYNQNGYNNFKWQRNYYDRIIRNEKEIFNIRKYILNNPLKWDLDNNNPVNWDKTNIKPLTTNFKYKNKWKMRFESSSPKLIPDIIKINENIVYKSILDQDLQIISKAIKDILGENIIIGKNKEIKDKLFEFKAYFRDLNQ